MRTLALPTLSTLALLGVTFVSGNACAEECPVVPELRPSPVTAGLDSRERLAFIDQQLAAAVGAARRHTFGWGGLQAASLATNAVLFSVGADDARPDRGIAAVTAAVGLATTIVSWPAVLRDQPRVAALTAPDATGSECLRLWSAERILLRDARHEAETRSFLRHLLNFGFVGSMTLILGAGYGRWPQAAFFGASSFLIGETIVFTRSTAANETLERYRAGDLAPPTYGPKPKVGFQVSPMGLSVVGTF